MLASVRAVLAFRALPIAFLHLFVTIHISYCLLFFQWGEGRPELGMDNSAPQRRQGRVAAEFWEIASKMSET